MASSLDKALEGDNGLAVFFAKDFVSTDQNVDDIRAGVPQADTRWCLLELPKDQLEKLQAGATFKFQQGSSSQPGLVERQGGPAKLCTENATFNCEFYENSNSLFVGVVFTPEATQPAAAPTQQEGCDASEATPTTSAGEPWCDIIAQCRGQMMPKAATPDNARVRDLLMPHSLGQIPRPHKMTTQQLEYEVAASSVELKSLLAKGPYVEHEGGWRLLPASLEREIIDAACTVITAQGWDPAIVDGERLLSEVRNAIADPSEDGMLALPCFAVLRKALQSILAAPKQHEETDKENQAGDKNVESVPDKLKVDDMNTLVLDREKMNMARAVLLLRDPASKVRERFQLERPAKRARVAGAGGAGAGLMADGGPDGPPLQFDEFAKIFVEITGKEATPEEVMKLISSSAYVDGDGSIHPLDVNALPQDPNERLLRLFELQTHWRPERLSVLLEPSLPAGTKVEPWLMKLTRQVFVEIEIKEGQKEEVRMMTKKF